MIIMSSLYVCMFTSTLLYDLHSQSSYQFLTWIFICLNKIVRLTIHYLRYHVKCF